MKRKLTLAQGMVEYALLLTMVTIPMIVIYATLGDAVGDVWQTVVDGLSDTQMFEVNDYTLGPTITSLANTSVANTAVAAITETVYASTYGSPTEVPTTANTVDPSGPPTETPVDTEIPQPTEIPPTATHFVPATYTPIPPTDVPTEIPTAIPPTETPVNTATPVQTPTPVYVSVTDVDSYWQGDTVFIEIYVDTRKEWIVVLNTTSGAQQTIKCSWYCTASFYDTTHVGGYVTITSDDGDYINYFYPARSW